MGNSPSYLESSLVSTVASQAAWYRMETDRKPKREEIGRKIEVGSQREMGKIMPKNGENIEEITPNPIVLPFRGHLSPFRAVGQLPFFGQVFPIFSFLRDGETTIKITFSLFEGGGALGAERKTVQSAVFFVGNATTIEF